MRIGFRTWNLTDCADKFALQSVAITGHTWTLIGANRALDHRAKRGEIMFVKPVPLQNTAGFYHYYDAEKARREYETRGMVGACMCWGRIAGKDGEGMFRSEYSQILAVTEPNWDRFSKPPQPSVPAGLTAKLWMVAVNKGRADLLQTAGSFRSYVESLATVLGIAPESLNFDRIHEEFEKHRSITQAEYDRYTQAMAVWHEQMKTWADEQSKRFRAQMPFPVYRRIEQLVAYAQKFGDLGPPDRGSAKGIPWWKRATLLATDE